MNDLPAKARRPGVEPATGNLLIASPAPEPPCHRVALFFCNLGSTYIYIYIYIGWSSGRAIHFPRDQPLSQRPGYITAIHTPPFPFGRISFVVLVMRKGGESSWSGPWHLGCTLEVFHVHSYQDQFIQPGWAEWFCVFTRFVLCVFNCAF